MNRIFSRGAPDHFSQHRNAVVAQRYGNEWSRGVHSSFHTCQSRVMNPSLMATERNAEAQLSISSCPATGGCLTSTTHPAVLLFRLTNFTRRQHLGLACHCVFVCVCCAVSRPNANVTHLRLFRFSTAVCGQMRGKRAAVHHREGRFLFRSHSTLRRPTEGIACPRR